MVSGVRQKAFIWIHEKRTKVSTSHHLFFTSCHLTFLFLWESSSEIWSHRKNRVFKSSNIEKYNFMTTSRIFSESHLSFCCSKRWTAWSCLTLLEHAWTCSNLLEQAWTCLKHAWICLNMLEHTWTCLNMLEHTWTCLNRLEHAWTCLKLLETAWTCLNLLDHPWTCLNMLDHPWTWSNFHELARISENLLDLAQICGILLKIAESCIKLKTWNLNLILVRKLKWKMKAEAF